MKIFIKIISCLLLIVTTVVLILYANLTKGPINISKVANYVLTLKFKNYVKCEKVILSLNQHKEYFLKITAANMVVNIKANPDSQKAFTIIQSDIIVPIKNLKKFNVYPDKIIVDGLHINLLKLIENKSILDISKFFYFFAHISNLIIKNSKIHILTNNNKNPSIFSVNLNYYDQKVKLILQNIYSKEKLNLDVSYLTKLQKINVQAKLLNFSSSMIKYFVSEKFDNINFNNLFLGIDYDYFLATKTHKLKFQSNVAKIICTNSNLSAGIQVENINLQGMVENNLFKLKPCIFLLNGIPIKITSVGQFNTVTNLILKTEIFIPKVKLPYFYEMWPLDWVVNAREWLTANIKSGFIYDNKINIEHSVQISTQGLVHKINSLNGFIALKNATLSYLDTMPKIEKLNAKADFDLQHFDIKILQGYNNKIAIQNGSVSIGDWDSKTIPQLNLKINLQGSIKKILEIINNKPLYYNRAYGLKPQQTQGEALVALEMSFPLQIPFNPQKIFTNVRAKINKFELNKLDNLNLQYKSDCCEVIVSPTKLQIISNGQLFGNKAEINVLHLLNKNILTLTIDTKLNKRLLLHLKLDHLVNFVQYESDVKLIYKNIDNHKTVNITSDLTPLEINFILFSKKLKEAANLCIDIAYDNSNNNFFLQKMKVYSPLRDWYVLANVAPNSGVSYIAKITCKHGKNNAQINIIQKSPQATFIDITSKQLNFKNADFLIFQNYKGLSNNKNTLYSIKFAADRLVWGNRPGLTNNKLQAYWQNNKIKRLDYKGQLETVGGEKGRIQAQISNNRYGQIFKLQTANGGEFFKAINIFDNIGGGNLQILAKSNALLKIDDWLGKAQLSNFTLYKAPMISELFSLLSPIHIVNLINNKGINFNIYKARFLIRENILHLQASKAYNSTTGILLDGYINYSKPGQTSLQGSLIPAYLINSLLANLPIIGSVLTGSRGSLFAITFSINGEWKNTKITANPFSVVTPIFLQNILTKNEMNFYKDKWLNKFHKTDNLF